MHNKETIMFVEKIITIIAASFVRIETVWFNRTLQLFLFCISFHSDGFHYDKYLHYKVLIMIHVVFFIELLSLFHLCIFITIIIHNNQTVWMARCEWFGKIHGECRELTVKDQKNIPQVIKREKRKKIQRFTSHLDFFCLKVSPNWNFAT